MRLIYYISSLFILLSLAGCEEAVTLDLNKIEPRLVIDASISASDGCTVKISKTQDFYSDELPELLDGAIINLRDNTQNLNYNLTENRVMAGLYSHDMPIIEGHEYTLTVEFEGKTYTATETVPEPVIIDSIYIIRITVGGQEDDAWLSPVIVFDDPAEVDNYYYNTLYVNGRRMKSIYMNDDKYKNGKTYERVLYFDMEDNNDENLKVGDEIIVEMENLTKNSYTYFSSIFSISAGGSVNPISNFSGDVLGCFKAYGRSLIDLKISEKDIKDL